MERGCRNCMWLYHMVTHNPTAPCSECLDYDKWQTTKRTNADRIRAMTDEELAEFVSGVEAEAIRRAGLFITTGDIKRGKDGWLDWLKQEGE